MATTFGAPSQHNDPGGERERETPPGGQRKGGNTARTKDGGGFCARHRPEPLQSRGPACGDVALVVNFQEGCPDHPVWVQEHLVLHSEDDPGLLQGLRGVEQEQGASLSGWLPMLCVGKRKPELWPFLRCASTSRRQKCGDDAAANRETSKGSPMDRLEGWPCAGRAETTQVKHARRGTRAPPPCFPYQPRTLSRNKFPATA